MEVPSRDVTVHEQGPSPPVGVHALLHGVLPLLASALRRQRERGRSAGSDLLSGLLIEDGEAESLLATLDRDLGRSEPSKNSESISAPRELVGFVGQVTTRFAVDRVGEIALALALGVEVDGRFARLVGYLNDHPSHVRPTLGLVWEVAEVPVGPSRISLLQAPIVRDAVLEVSGDGPISTREVRIVADLVPRFVGVPGAESSLRVTKPSDGQAPVEIQEEAQVGAQAWLQAAKRGAGLPLVIEGPPGSGRTSLARLLFGVLGFGTVSGTRDPRVLRREARLHGAGIVAIPQGDLAAWWAELADVRWPIAVVVSPEEGAALRAVMSDEPVTVRLDVPDVGARARLWRASAVGQLLGPNDAALMAARFPFTPSKINRAAERAAQEPWAEGLLSQICREVAAASFDGLARRLPKVYRREDLVLPMELEQEFALALSWVHHRQQVLGDWKLGRRLADRWGLTLLLAGPPGTGKTMAAQVLAQELETDIYRVDLSQVVSKYIGETEKHLGALLTAAQQSGAVLLFDEADALFGRRSEVRDARDRYANIEVGFLLQRIEEHEGIVLLSTNRMGDMDEAFQRRFQFVLSFPLPDRELRTHIWERLLPWEACTDGVDVAVLADRFRLSGGQIRNAVVAAAFLAASEDVKIGQGHLLAALRREVLKTGRVLRAEEREDPAGAVDPRGRRRVEG